MKRLLIAFALLLAVGVGQAQAGLLTVQPVTGNLQQFLTPSGGDQPNEVIPGLWGYLNGNLVLNGAVGQNYLVTFTLIGSESGWTNQLRETQGNTVLVEQADIGKSISYVTTGTGVAQDLKFQFETIAGSTQPILVNGMDPDGSAGAYITNGPSTSLRTFFVSFCVGSDLTSPVDSAGLNCNVAGNATEGNIAWLALDDSGAGPNDNHDDWVGYVRVTAVPDGGATLGLLGAALLGLGALRRSFRN